MNMFLCVILIIVDSVLQANAVLDLNSGGALKRASTSAPSPVAAKVNHLPSKKPRKMVRVAIKDTDISPELVAINDRLKMDGEKKELTKKQAKWIERFITTINNWLYLVHMILKTAKFKELYQKHLHDDFDLWITGNKDQAFDMIYKNELDPKEPPVHYKIILYRISFLGIGYADFNLKSFEIGFERSRNMMMTPYGEMVFRKDRIYTLELEAELPITDVKIRHEIVGGKEEGQFDPFTMEDDQEVKPGYMRLRLSNVKLYAKVQLTEIDKRFLREDPETKETYCFEKPLVFDFKFSVRDAMVFKPDLQRKPGLPEGHVGKGLTDARARIILKDFVEFIVQNKYESELNHRLSIALINKYSKAIMLTPDILLLPFNLDKVTTNYSYVFLTVSDIEGDGEEDMVVGYKIFYMSYSLKTFLNACKYFIFKALELQTALEESPDESKLSEEELAKKKKVDEETEQKLIELGNEAGKWMDDQVAKASKGLGIRDDGFDWDEDKPKEKSAIEGVEVSNDVEGSVGEAEWKPPLSHSSTIDNDLPFSEIEAKLNSAKQSPPIERK